MKRRPKRPRGRAPRRVTLDGKAITVGAIGDEGAVFAGGVFVGFVSLEKAFRASRTGKLRRRDIRPANGTILTP